MKKSSTLLLGAVAVAAVISRVANRALSVAPPKPSPWTPPKPADKLPVMPNVPKPTQAPSPVAVLGVPLVPGQAYRGRITVFHWRSLSHDKVIERLIQYFDPIREFDGAKLPADWPQDQRAAGKGDWTLYVEGVYTGGAAGTLATKSKDYEILGIWAA